MPVVIGGGRPFFGELSPGDIPLGDPTTCIQSDRVIHLVFPVPHEDVAVGLRVTDRVASVAFYAALGYEVVGEVPESPLGHLTMLKLPGDEFVTLERLGRFDVDTPCGDLPPGAAQRLDLVQWPPRHPDGFTADDFAPSSEPG